MWDGRRYDEVDIDSDIVLRERIGPMCSNDLHYYFGTLLILVQRQLERSLLDDGAAPEYTNGTHADLSSQFELHDSVINVFRRIWNDDISLEIRELTSDFATAILETGIAESSYEYSLPMFRKLSQWQTTAG